MREWHREHKITNDPIPKAMQVKLKKGRTFSKPQEKLNRIYEIFDEDMVCAFCESWFYDEIAKVIGYDLDS